MNYKVRVNDEAESKEVQELFFELGYKWRCKHESENFVKKCVSHIYSYSLCKGITHSSGETYFVTHENKEITIQQLKDLVVLERNDVVDSNYTCCNKFYYLTNNEFYEYINNKWVNVDEFVDGLYQQPEQFQVNNMYEKVLEKVKKLVI